MSMLKTRFKRCAQVMAARRSAGVVSSGESAVRTLRPLPRLAGVTCGPSAGGGALFINSCPIEIRRSIFSRNIVANTTSYDREHGGAIHINNSSGSALTEHCIFDRNRTGNSIGRLGGALYLGAGDLLVSNCTFSGNNTSGEGGAIAVGGGAPTLVYCLS